MAAKVRPCLIASIPATLDVIRELGELTEPEMQDINDRLKFWLNLD